MTIFVGPIQGGGSGGGFVPADIIDPSVVDDQIVTYDSTIEKFIPSQFGAKIGGSNAITQQLPADPINASGSDQTVVVPTDCTVIAANVDGVTLTLDFGDPSQLALDTIKGCFVYCNPSNGGVVRFKVGGGYFWANNGDPDFDVDAVVTCDTRLYSATSGTGGILQVVPLVPTASTLPDNLQDGEMLRYNAATLKYEGTGDINTDVEVNFGTKIVKAGTGTFKLGEAHSMSSGGENVTFTNLVDGDRYNPVWISQEGNVAEARMTIEPLVTTTPEASKADVVVNPTWISNPLVDWRVFTVTYEAETPVNDAVLTVKKDGVVFWQAKLDPLIADTEVTTDLGSATSDNVPPDAFVGGIYTVEITSPTQEVRLKGNTTTGEAFNVIQYKAFEDKNIFDMDNMQETSTSKVMTGSERTKLASLTGGMYLGVFADLASLQTAHPTATTGDIATVTSPSSNIFYWNVSVWTDSGTGHLGDMLKAVYDPSAKNADAFSMGNMDETATAKVLTGVERSNIAGNTSAINILGPQVGQNVTDIGTLQTTKLDDVNSGFLINVDKTTPLSPTINVGFTIGSGLEVNVSDELKVIDDLLDGGPSTLHYHESDRDRVNHTGTQTASTISDFDAEVSNNTDVTANTSKVSFPEAPNDGGEYVRKNLGWSVNTGEANNISDIDATDLTDSGETALHYHDSDRDRANHTGTQAVSTISDFDTEVANNTAVAANTAKVSYVLATWGANLQTVGRHPAINSPADSGQISSLGIYASMPIPADGILDTLTYYTNTGDNTTTLQIVKNGVVESTFNCDAAYGVETGIGLSVNVFDNIAIRYSGGTAPSEGLYTAYVK